MEVLTKRLAEQRWKDADGSEDGRLIIMFLKYQTARAISAGCCHGPHVGVAMVTTTLIER